MRVEWYEGDIKRRFLPSRNFLKGLDQEWNTPFQSLRLVHQLPSNGTGWQVAAISVCMSHATFLMNTISGARSMAITKFWVHPEDRVIGILAGRAEEDWMATLFEHQRVCSTVQKTKETTYTKYCQGNSLEFRLDISAKNISILKN